MSAKFRYASIPIQSLYVNPENYRYVDDAENEVGAIIAMFNVPMGDPHKEMFNLATDIVKDGLNPFEMPVVCYDEELGKYITHEGNRRLSCIKLMTQYKGNTEILKEVPSVAEIYNLNYLGEDSIECVIYDDPDDAKRLLNKIHQDLNEGIGRKQWDHFAKIKANAISGNVSKAFAIIAFVRNHPNVNPKLVQEMLSKRWTSKLERVVGFAKFRETYNISFDKNCEIVYQDTEEQALTMMERLIYDLLNNSATDNFRFKTDFDQYTDKLENKYKTQVTTSAVKTLCTDTETVDTKNETAAAKNSGVCESKNEKQFSNEESSQKSAGMTQDNQNGVGMPKPISRRHTTGREALRLSKEYSDDEYSCLNEKGKEMLVEIESLNIKEYPVATAALCRCLTEYTTKLWLDEMGGDFDSRALASTYGGCLNRLRAKEIISNNEHCILKTQINSQDFITLLNTWMHANTDACVSETPLISGWKNIRLLIEKYIDGHRKRD